MKVMSFNVRGLGKRMKRMDVKQKIIQYHIDFCYIQESKIETMDTIIGTELWYDREFDWEWREVEGRSGGIISIWSRKVNGLQETVDKEADRELDSDEWINKGTLWDWKETKLKVYVVVGHGRGLKRIH
ncbi:hypothetical protein ACS0TY_013257 [Phlomoides rotata]